MRNRLSRRRRQQPRVTANGEIIKQIVVGERLRQQNRWRRENELTRQDMCI
jgi:hypothetical protein